MNVEDLDVDQRLVELVIRVHEWTMRFPKFELYELGSQLRRSSNSIPANVAEGFSNKHTNIYTECISRSLGELRETKHHLYIAHRKKYIPDEVLRKFTAEYDICSKMLWRLQESLRKKPLH